MLDVTLPRGFSKTLWQKSMRLGTIKHVPQLLKSGHAVSPGGRINLTKNTEF